MTIVAAAMVAVLLVATVGASYLGTAVVARHRAQAAADLAALAAAARLPAGAGSACALAEQIVRDMRAGEADCVVDELDVVITIEAAVGRWGSAHAEARAGPAQPPRPASSISADVGRRSETSPA